MGRDLRRLLLAAALAARFAMSAVAHADLAPEALGRSVEVAPTGPRQAFYLDIQRATFPGGRFVLFDIDSLDFLAHLPAGQLPTLHVAPEGDEVYVISTFLHGPAAEPHDVVAIYDTRHYALIDEIPLAGRKRALMAPDARSALIHDGKLLVVFNFTPATSIQVIDIRGRRHLAEIPTPGCSLVYPTARSGVSMLCGDGRLLTLHFDANGAVSKRHRSQPFFDPDVDPIMENAAWIDGKAHFASYGGQIHTVDLSGERPVFEEPWPLSKEPERPEGVLEMLMTGLSKVAWLPGGMQILAAHSDRKELFVLMHPVPWSEGHGDHVFPGLEVWVYDVAERRRVRRMPLEGVAASIYVTPDAEPRLLASGVDISSEDMRLEVYDAVRGGLLGWMPEFGEIVMTFHSATGTATHATGTATASGNEGGVP